MATRRNHDVRSSKSDTCDVLCNTFNKLRFKNASNHYFYEDYVLLRNQLLLLEYDEDDPSIPSKLFDVTELLRRYIEDVPKPVQETVEFVEDIHRKLRFLHECNCRHIKLNKRFPLSQELHMLLIRYVELEYEVLYCSHNYTPEYQKKVENRIISLLLIMMYDPTTKRGNENLVKSVTDTCAINALYIMRSVKPEYKKQHKLIENIMIKLLRKLNILDKVNEMRSKNKTLTLENLLQVPQVQRMYEYLQNRDYAATDDYNNPSEDEVEEVVEIQPVKDEAKYNIEEKIKVSSFACYSVQRKVMTIDLADEDEDCYMVYFQPEVEKLDKKEKKIVLEDFNVQNSARTTSNISDTCDNYSQLNNFSTSSTCDSSRCVNSDASVFVVDDNDSDIEIFCDNSLPVVNLVDDSCTESTDTSSTPLIPEEQISEQLHAAGDASHLEDALLQCDDISDNEIENEDEILNRYNEDEEDANEVLTTKPEVLAPRSKALPISTNENEKENSRECENAAVNFNKESPCEENVIDGTATEAVAIINEINSDPIDDSCENVINSDSIHDVSINKSILTNVESNADGRIESEVSVDDASNTTNDANKVTIATQQESAPNECTEQSKDVTEPLNKSVQQFTCDTESINNDVVEERVIDFNQPDDVENKATEVLTLEIQNCDSVRSEPTNLTDDTNNYTNEELPETNSEELQAKSVDEDTHIIPSENDCATREGEYIVHDDLHTGEIVEEVIHESCANDFIVEETVVTDAIEQQEIEDDRENSSKHELINTSEECLQEVVVDDILPSQDVPFNEEISISNEESHLAVVNDSNSSFTEEVVIATEAGQVECEAVNSDSLPFNGEVEVRCASSELKEPEVPSSSRNIENKVQEGEQVNVKEEIVTISNKTEDKSESNSDIVDTTVEVTTSPSDGYTTQTSSEDSEQLVCSNYLDVLATVAAECSKMEDAVQAKPSKKKGKKGRKAKKKVNLEPLKMQENEMVTRRITRSNTVKKQESQTQPKTLLEMQEQCKCIPSTFMNLENLITPPPICVYNLISNNVTDNEESLDEPFGCIHNCENPPNLSHLNEISTRDTVFDEDTIEDGISFVNHLKHVNEAVISIPDCEKEYPGINYDILKQTEEFEKTNLSLSSPEELCKELNLKKAKNNFPDLHEIYKQNSREFLTDEHIETHATFLPQEKSASSIEPENNLKMISGNSGNVNSNEQQIVNIGEVVENDRESFPIVLHENQMVEAAHSKENAPSNSSCENNSLNVVSNAAEKLAEVETRTCEPENVTLIKAETSSMSVPPKKNKRRTWFNKTVAQSVPVKKRKNYGRKNVTNNSEKEDKVLEERQTEIAEVPSVKDTDESGLSKNVEATESKIVSTEVINNQDTELQLESRSLSTSKTEENTEICKAESIIKESDRLSVVEETEEVASHKSQENVVVPTTADVVEESRIYESTEAVEQVDNVIEGLSTGIDKEVVEADSQLLTSQENVEKSQVTSTVSESDFIISLRSGDQDESNHLETAEAMIHAEEIVNTVDESQKQVEEIKTNETNEIEAFDEPLSSKNEVSVVRPMLPAEFETPGEGTVSELETSGEEIVSELETPGEETICELESPGEETVSELETSGEEIVSELETPGEETICELESPGEETVSELETSGEEIVSELETPGGETVCELEMPDEEVVSELETPVCVLETPDETSKLDPLDSVDVNDMNKTVPAHLPTEFDSRRNSIEMPVLEKEQESHSLQEKNNLTEDNYPMLVAYEIETVSEEVYESCVNSEELQTSPEPQLVEEMPVVQPRDQELLQSSDQIDTNKRNVANAISNVETKTTSSDVKRRNRPVRTKAALKAFQNPYVQLQKLPLDFNYKTVHSNDKSSVTDTSASSYTQQKHDQRSPELKIESDGTPISSKKEKAMKQKEIRLNSGKNIPVSVITEKEESHTLHSKIKEDKLEDARTKTRSSSQKQREKQEECSPPAKILRSFSDGKIESKREKDSDDKNRHRIIKELPLFSVEDDFKLTSIKKRRKSEPEKETSKCDISTISEKSRNDKHTAKEEKRKGNHTEEHSKPPHKDKSRCNSRSNSKSDSSISKLKVEEHELEGSGRRHSDACDVKTDTKKICTNESKSESYSSRRHSTRSRSSSVNEKINQKDTVEVTSIDKKISSELKVSDLTHRSSRRSSKSSSSISPQDIKCESSICNEKHDYNKKDVQLPTIDPVDKIPKSAQTTVADKSETTKTENDINQYSRERRESLRTRSTRDKLKLKNDSQPVEEKHGKSEQLLKSDDTVTNKDKGLKGDVKSKSNNKVKTRNDSRHNLEKISKDIKVPSKQKEKEESVKVKSHVDEVKIKKDLREGKSSERKSVLDEKVTQITSIVEPEPPKSDGDSKIKSRSRSKRSKSVNKDLELYNKIEENKSRSTERVKDKNDEKTKTSTDKKNHSPPVVAKSPKDTEANKPSERSKSKKEDKRSESISEEAETLVKPEILQKDVTKELRNVDSSSSTVKVKHQHRSEEKKSKTINQECSSRSNSVTDVSNSKEASRSFRKSTRTKSTEKTKTDVISKEKRSHSEVLSTTESKNKSSSEISERLRQSEKRKLDADKELLRTDSSASQTKKMTRSSKEEISGKVKVKGDSVLNKSEIVIPTEKVEKSLKRKHSSEKPDVQQKDEKKHKLRSREQQSEVEPKLTVDTSRKNSKTKSTESTKPPVEEKAQKELEHSVTLTAVGEISQNLSEKSKKSKAHTSTIREEDAQNSKKKMKLVDVKQSSVSSKTSESVNQEPHGECSKSERNKYDKCQEKEKSKSLKEEIKFTAIPVDNVGTLESESNSDGSKSKSRRDRSKTKADTECKEKHKRQQSEVDVSKTLASVTTVLADESAQIVKTKGKDLKSRKDLKEQHSTVEIALTESIKNKNSPHEEKSPEIIAAKKSIEEICSTAFTNKLAEESLPENKKSDNIKEQRTKNKSKTEVNKTIGDIVNNFEETISLQQDKFEDIKEQPTKNKRKTVLSKTIGDVVNDFEETIPLQQDKSEDIKEQPTKNKRKTVLSKTIGDVVNDFEETIPLQQNKSEDIKEQPTKNKRKTLLSKTIGDVVNDFEETVPLQQDKSEDIKEQPTKNKRKTVLSKTIGDVVNDIEETIPLQQNKSEDIKEQPTKNKRKTVLSKTIGDVVNDFEETVPLQQDKSEDIKEQPTKNKRKTVLSKTIGDEVNDFEETIPLQQNKLEDIKEQPTKNKRKAVLSKTIGDEVNDFEETIPLQQNKLEDIKEQPTKNKRKTVLSKTIGDVVNDFEETIPLQHDKSEDIKEQPIKNKRKTVLSKTIGDVVNDFEETIPLQQEKSEDPEEQPTKNKRKTVLSKTIGDVVNDFEETIPLQQEKSEDPKEQPTKNKRKAVVSKTIGDVVSDFEETIPLQQDKSEDIKELSTKNKSRTVLMNKTIGDRVNNFEETIPLQQDKSEDIKDQLTNNKSETVVDKTIGDTLNDVDDSIPQQQDKEQSKKPVNEDHIANSTEVISKESVEDSHEQNSRDDKSKDLLKAQADSKQSLNKSTDSINTNMTPDESEIKESCEHQSIEMEHLDTPGEEIVTAEVLSDHVEVDAKSKISVDSQGIEENKKHLSIESEQINTPFNDKVFTEDAPSHAETFNTKAEEDKLNSMEDKHVPAHVDKIAVAEISSDCTESIKESLDSPEIDNNKHKSVEIATNEVSPDAENLKTKASVDAQKLEEVEESLREREEVVAPEMHKNCDKPQTEESKPHSIEIAPINVSVDNIAAIEVLPDPIENLKTKEIEENTKHQSIVSEQDAHIGNIVAEVSPDLPSEKYRNKESQIKALDQKRRLSEDTSNVRAKRPRRFTITDLIAETDQPPVIDTHDSKLQTSTSDNNCVVETTHTEIVAIKSRETVPKRNKRSADKQKLKKKDPKNIDSIIENLKNRKSHLEDNSVELIENENNESKVTENMDLRSVESSSSNLQQDSPTEEVSTTKDTTEILSEFSTDSKIIEEVIVETNDSQVLAREDSNLDAQKARDDVEAVADTVEQEVIDDSFTEESNISSHDMLKSVDPDVSELEVIESSLTENQEIPETNDSPKQPSERTNIFFTEQENYELMLQENRSLNMQSSVFENNQEIGEQLLEKDLAPKPPIAADNFSGEITDTNLQEMVPISHSALTETVDSNHLLNDEVCENIFPYTSESNKTIEGDCLPDNNVAFSETVEISTLPNDILNFKEATSTTNSNQHTPTSVEELFQPKKPQPIPSTSTTQMMHNLAITNSVAQINQIPISTAQLLGVTDKPQTEEVMVNLSTSTAEASTSCETTDNLIAVIFSNVCNDSEQSRANKTGFIYFRGTDHNYHSIGDPLLGGECDTIESDRSSDTSKEIPSPELESVLVDDNILPYINTLTENNQEPSSSLNESSVDSSTDFQLLEQCLIGNSLGRESSPPLPQTITCDNLYQANLKQEVLEYDDNSASNNMEFPKENSEVYINQFQQQAMSVENMSELMNVVLTSIQNLNNMTRPTQNNDSPRQENLFQPTKTDFNIDMDTAAHKALGNARSQNLESNCNFTQVQENNVYVQPETPSLSFVNDISETDFTNFYYLPVAYDNTIIGNNSSNKKVIVERIPQFPESTKSALEMNNENTISPSASSTHNRVVIDVHTQSATATKTSHVPPVKKALSAETTTVQANQLPIIKVKQSEPARSSSSLNLGFVRTSSRTRVSAPKPKKPSDHRKSVDDSESNATDGNSSGAETETPVNHRLKLKVRQDLNGALENQCLKVVPARGRSLCIIEDPDVKEQGEPSSTAASVKTVNNKQVEEATKPIVTKPTKPKENVIVVEPSKQRTPKQTSPSCVVEKPDVASPSRELPKANQKPQTIDLNALKDLTQPETVGQSDMIDNVKRRKRKPVDYSSIEKLLENDEFESLRMSQKNKNKKEESEDVAGRSKTKRKQDSIEEKQPKSKSKSAKPANEVEKNKPLSSSDVEADVQGSKSNSIFEDSDDDIPKKKKSKPEGRLEPEMMNALFDKLVQEGNINTIKTNNGNKSSREENSSNFEGVDSQKILKDSLEAHSSAARTIPTTIFNLEAGLQKKPDAITPVKQIGVVNPIPRPSNNLRKEPPCNNRNSYSGGNEEGRNSSQYYPYYAERSRRSYPYSSRESSRSSHQGNSRRPEYPSHSSEARYSSQRSSSSSRSSRSSRHHSNSRSSAEQRSYRYASSATSDLAWREDMKKKFPHMFKDEVFF